jgi:hypothetical protein
MLGKPIGYARLHTNVQIWVDKLGTTSRSCM